LKSDDKRIERNKKQREAYRMKKDATQIKMNFTAEHHVEPVISIPTTIEDPTSMSTYLILSTFVLSV